MFNKDELEILRSLVMITDCRKCTRQNICVGSVHICNYFINKLTKLIEGKEV
jgi:hypothetical protein